MPNARPRRKTRNRREAQVQSCAQWFLKDVLPLFRPPRMPRTRSARHLRNATIEVLEAVRAVLDEAIEWLRHEGKGQAELKRIRVEG